MDIIIGQVIICILAFFILRAYLAGYLLYRVANVYVDKLRGVGVKREIELRNFYLFVFNPFWWTPTQCFKSAGERMIFKRIVKEVKKFLDNSQR